MKTVTLNTATKWVLDKAFSPVVIVTTFDTMNNRPTGMTAGWSIPCSTEPLMYSVALWKKGYTHTLLQESSSFAINIPNKALLKTVKIFGSKHGDKLAKFDLAKVKYELWGEKKVPILSEASAIYICEKKDVVDCGDHFIFIGKVVESFVDPKRKTLINTGKHGRKREFIEV